MSSQTGKLERRAAKVRAGGRSVVNVGGELFEFVGVVWGGVSPRVSLRSVKTGEVTTMLAKAWANAGARF